MVDISGTRASAAFLGVMTLGYAVYAADRTVLTAMLVPMAASLGLTGLQQGLLVSAQYAGVLSSVFVAGYLSDVYGKWRVVAVGVAVFTAFTWLIGLSTDFYQAFAFRFVSGVGEGIFWPVAMSAVANYFGSRKGLALGAFYVGFDLGGATGNAVGGATYSLTSDWRAAFFVAPLLGIAVLAGLVVARKTITAAEEGTGRLSIGREATAVLKRKPVLVVLAFALLVTYPTSAWQSFLPKYLKDVLGLSIPAAAYATAGVLLAGGAGKVVIGRASDRWPRNRVLLASTASALLLYLVFFSTSAAVLGIAAGLAIGFVSSAVFPVMQALASDLGGARMGTMLGLTTTFQSVATVFSPTVTSLLFPGGVGAAVAYNVVIPMCLVVAVALLLRDPRVSGGRSPLRLSEPGGR